MSPYAAPVPADAPEAEEEPPVASILEPSAPNPFNITTRISYRIAAPGPVRLEVVNALGQSLHTLVNEVQAPGTYRVYWNARNQSGSPVAAGGLLHPPPPSWRRAGAAAALSQVGLASTAPWRRGGRGRRSVRRQMCPVGARAHLAEAAGVRVQAIRE